MDKKDSSSKKLKTEVGSTSYVIPVLMKYISLEEAAKNIPRFDGYNIKVTIFICECKRALSHINPRDKERFRDLIISKVIGVEPHLYSYKKNIHDFLEKLYDRYTAEERDFIMIKDPHAYKQFITSIDIDRKKQLDYLEAERSCTEQEQMTDIRKLLLTSCEYCQYEGHTEEDHYGSFLLTTNKFKMLESNRLSRHLFLNKLYLRQLGVVQPKYQKCSKFNSTLMDIKDIPLKRLKKKLGPTFRAKPIRTKYISLEEAAKYIPRFDGYNMIVSIFINECKRALKLIRPRDMEHLKHFIISKLFGEPALLFSDIYSVHDLLGKVYLHYVNRKIVNMAFYIAKDPNQELENLESQTCHTKNTNSEIIPELFFYFCNYCKLNGHTEENHCCSLLETNKMFKMLERNRLSRRLFLNKLYLREIGVTLTPDITNF